MTIHPLTRQRSKQVAFLHLATVYYQGLQRDGVTHQLSTGFVG
jgi:hypothetical protein